MFIIDGFHTLVWSFQMYFSHFLFWGIGILIAAGRVSQVLFKEKFNKTTYILSEIGVEGFRILQYILFILIGEHILSITNLWPTVINGFQEITFLQIIWEFLGFTVIFGVYNVLIFVVLNKKNVTKIMMKYHIMRYSFKTFKLALILGIKNLFLIPISVIYLLYLLNIIQF